MQLRFDGSGRRRNDSQARNKQAYESNILQTSRGNSPTMIESDSPTMKISAAGQSPGLRPGAAIGITKDTANHYTTATARTNNNSLYSEAVPFNTAMQAREQKSTIAKLDDMGKIWK